MGGDVYRDVDLRSLISGIGRASWRPRMRACCELSGPDPLPNPRWKSANSVSTRQHGWADNPDLIRRVRWVAGELWTMSALIRDGKCGNHHTISLQEMTPVVSSNT